MLFILAVIFVTAALFFAVRSAMAAIWKLKPAMILDLLSLHVDLIVVVVLLFDFYVHWFYYKDMRVTSAMSQYTLYVFCLGSGLYIYSMIDLVGMGRSSEIYHHIVFLSVMSLIVFKVEMRIFLFSYMALQNMTGVIYHSTRVIEKGKMSSIKGVLINISFHIVFRMILPLIYITLFIVSFMHLPLIARIVMSPVLAVNYSLNTYWFIAMIKILQRKMMRKTSSNKVAVIK